MQRLDLGGVEIDGVLEHQMRFRTDFLLAGSDPAGSRAEAARLGPRLMDADGGHLVIAMQSYVIRTRGLTIVVDTGCGDGRQRPSAPFLHQLQSGYLQGLDAAGVRTEEVDIVFNTHLHVDHVGWNVRHGPDGFRPTFPNARYLFGRPEYEWWKAAIARDEVKPYMHECFDECVETVRRAGLVEHVAAGDRIVDTPDVSIEVISLPGHTMHQQGLIVRGSEATAVLTADAVHHAIQFTRTGWRSRADADPALAERTVYALIDRWAGTDAFILTAHSPHPNVSRLRRIDGETRLVFAG